MNKLCSLTALQLSSKIRKKEISVREAVEASFLRIEEREGELHSFLHLARKEALKEAEAVQQRLKEGAGRLSLAGVPWAAKDNISVKGFPLTCGSRMLEGFLPTYDAHVAKRLKEEGAVLLGKTNMDEFGMGSATENSAFGPTANPANPLYSPGGSSGGSGAAVASGEAFFALGSDTGGSVRLPAAHCGLVGLKPTYGRVSRYGLVAYGSSLEQIGPLTRDVADCRAVYRLIAGKDDRDITTSDREITFRQEEMTDVVKGKKIGILRECFTGRLDKEIAAAIREAVKLWEEQGALAQECGFSLLGYLVPAYYTIALAEASSNLARFDGIRYGRTDRGAKSLGERYLRGRSRGLGEEVKRRIMLGAFVLSEGSYQEYYLQSSRLRRLITERLHGLFTQYDILVMPVSENTAPLLKMAAGAGEESACTPGTAAGGNPEPAPSLEGLLENYLGDCYTVLANLTGVPAISLPCKKSGRGLPIGIQLLARPFDEEQLFAFGLALERARGKGTG